MEKEKEEDITLKEIWELFYSHIYWFIASVVVALCCAYAYTIFTPPVFTHTASVMIGNRSRTASKADNMDAFGASNFSAVFNINTDATSEMHIFLSPTLMEQVVQKLGLDYDYSMKYKSVRWISLYKSSPVQITLDPSLAKREVSMKISVVDSRHVELSEVNLEGKLLNFDKKVELGQSVQLPYGTLKVIPTSYYKEYLGEDIQFAKLPVHMAAQIYGGGLSADMCKDESPIVELTFHDTNHDRADDVLRTLIDVYNENWINDKNQVTVSTSAFINERLKVIESELGNVDNNISSFKSSRMMPDVTAVTQVYLAQSTDNQREQTNLQNQLSVAQYILSFIQDHKFKDQLLPANVGITDPNINTQITNYNTLLLEKNRLAQVAGDQNPQLKEMERSLAMMRNTVVRSVRSYVSSVQIKLNNSLSAERSTNSKLAANPTEAKYLLSEERKQKVKEGLYLFLLQQREQNELNQTFTAYNTKVVNAPEDSGAPASPRRSMVMLVALIIGLAVPAVILWLLNNFDTLIRKREDLKSLSVPYLGEIPFEGKRPRLFRRKKEMEDELKPCPIVVAAEKQDAVNEAFRNIRTNIDFMKPKTEGGVVIMNNSLVPDSGKTFFNINMAVAMSLKHDKVLVIDADLRKASLSRNVDSPRKGLSNYLVDEIHDVDEVIVRGTLQPTLDVLPVGTIPPNPAELLLSPRFSELLDFCRSQYDYIFIDCPPTEIVTDSTIIAKLCDMTLFIIRSGNLDKRLLPEIEELYQKHTYNNLSIVLNGVDFEEEHKYGYHRYGYKYGYRRYGYGSYYKKK